MPGALSPEALWLAVRSGRDLITRVDPDRWGVAADRVMCAPEAPAPDRTWSDRGGYVRGFEDVFLAGEHAGLLDGLDPQFRWTFHTAAEALRDGGGQWRRTGAIFGNLSFPTASMARYAESVWSGQGGADPRNRFMSGLPALMLARALGLEAGAFALDAACASSLYAIKLACDRLHDGAADTMLAGAVNCADDLFIHVGFSALGAMSRSGRSRPFHADADGLVPAEGAAFVALRRLADAEARGDRILGVIRGVGLSNDGRGRGLLAPSVEGQVRAMRQAYAQADVDPASVSLVECHATGTIVGDGAELQSMSEVFCDARNLPIGSLKSNLGHLITAAGVAGLIKVTESMQAGLRPATLHVDAPLPAIASSPLRLLDVTETWDDQQRRAAVSAFGFGGNNAHLIVDAEPPASRASVVVAGVEPAAVGIVGVGASLGDASDADAVWAVIDGARPATCRSGAITLAVDSLRFPPKDLARALPQQLLVLQVAAEAVADANIELPRTRTGVYVGMGADPEVARYGARWRGLGDVVDPLDAAGVVGTMPNIVANRLNSHFDLGGPSFVVCAEEASGVQALALAVRALSANEIDVAIVAAVDLADQPVHRAASEAVGSGGAADGAVAFVLQRVEADQPAIVVAAAECPAVRSVTGASAPAAASSLPRPHAAAGLVDVLRSVLQLQRRARGDGSPDLDGERRAVVDVTAMEGALVQVVLTGQGAQPPARPVARVFSGANAEEVVAALDAGRESDCGPARLVLVGTDPARVDRARRHLLHGAPAGPGVHFRAEPIDGEVAFVFAAAGAAYHGMGRDLLAAMPALSDRLQARFHGLGAAMAWAFDPDHAPTVLDRLWGASSLCQLHAELTLHVLGLSPTAAIGYSSGETNALFAFGAWRDLDAMVADAAASGLFERRAGWATWSVRAPVEVVADLIASEPLVHLAIIHGDRDCIIAGDASRCDVVVSRLGAGQCSRVDYDIPVHVDLPDLDRTAWSAIHARETFDVQGVRFYSNARDVAYAAGADACATAITDQALGPIDLRATVERAYADGVRVFIEHGPRAAVGGWIREILGDRDAVVVSLDREGAGLEAVHDAAAALLAAGVRFDPSRLFDRYRQSPKTLSFDSHWRQVDLGPPPVREVTPVTNPAPGPVVAQRMAPAPALPRITDLDASEVADDVADCPTPQAPAAPPPPSPSAAPATPMTPPPSALAAQLRAFQARISAQHSAFVARQTAVHQQFLKVQQNATLAMLASVGASTSGPAAQPAAPPARPEINLQRNESAPPARPAINLHRGLPGALSPAQVSTRPAINLAPEASKTPASNATQIAAPLFDRGQLEVHASGTISSIFGPQFAGQDDFARQVRMPEPPLLLADRVMRIDAVPGSMGKGSLVTETDVTADGWYLNEGYMPAGVMIESGQADLLLISYLGVDALNTGERVYRLLGCELTYHQHLPRPGETLSYDIHVDGHANHGDVRLFFFHYDCRVDGQPRLTVNKGQAGFFTDAELAESAGVLWSAEEQEVVAEPRLSPPAIECTKRSFDRAEIAALSEGRGWACFGAGFELLKTHVRTPKIQSGKMCFLEAVSHFEPRGGPWGRGYARAETTIHADDWFFDGHFKNDPCMPGTLMFEGCLQLMSLFLAGLGYTVQRDGWRFEPVPDEAVALQCRGQVTPSSQRLVYEVFVEEVLDGPVPTLYADLLCTVDGLKAFHARRMGLRLVPDWPMTSQPALLADHVEPKPVAEAGGFSFDYASLLACAWGKPSDAFGPMYEVFDDVRRVARLPGPPYHFMSRVTKIDGQIGVCEPGAVIEIEYDIPPDAWYFNENGAPTMPFAVLLEAALQPCGWLASFVGSALTVDRDLSFRNLDGTGTLLDELLVDAGTLRTVVKITNISQSAGMIIESFEVQCYLGDRKVYVMDTVFGFFPVEALRAQVGLPTSDAQRALLDAASDVTIDLTSSPVRYCSGAAALARPMLRMLDRVTGYWPEGGAHGLGALRAEKDVDPGEWFFKAHFFQDPVQPGSLGIEAMIQLLQLYMLETDMQAGVANPRFEPLALDAPLKWKYRGQVVPSNSVISTTMEIIEVGADERGPFAFATASLWVDGKRIYEAERLGMRIVGGGDGRVLDPEVDRWVNDHCPTWTVPALPMMSIVDRLAGAVDGPVVGMRDVRVKRWVVLDRPRTLRTTVHGDQVTLLCDEEPVASGVVSTGVYPPAPEAWPEIEGLVAESPYDTGALFHGPAFQVLERLVRGDGGSSAILRADLSAVPVGSLNQALLDGATHAIEHERGDKVSYPVMVTQLSVHGPTPVSGRVRCEVRADGHLGGEDYPAHRVQLITGDRVWLTMRLVEASFDKGPLGRTDPASRRDFLRDRRFVDGLQLSSGQGAERRLSPAQVAATDWLPGTVAAIYGTTDAADIALAESVSVQTGLHPSVGDLAALPLSKIQPVLRTDGEDVVAAAQLSLDVSEVRRYWTDWFAHEPWLVEDLYYGLIEQFVRRVLVPEPAALAAIRGRSALYVGNHQVGVESLLFSVIVSGLGGVPTVTLAKKEHEGTWLGRLIRHAFTYPGIVDPQVITYFDREDRESLPKIIGDLAEQMTGPGRSVMVHVEGTRSLDCTTGVQKMSGAFIDMAMAVDAPIVPVRFVGGLPRVPLSERIEYPVGMGRQDIWIGAPLLPEVLRPLHYGARKDAVIAAINDLGPSNAVETPIEGDPSMVAAAAAWSAKTGVDSEHSVLLEVLRRVPEPCAETQRLLAAIDAGLPAEGPWLAELARRLRG